MTAGLQPLGTHDSGQPGWVRGEGKVPFVLSNFTLGDILNFNGNSYS